MQVVSLLMLTMGTASTSFAQRQAVLKEAVESYRSGDLDGARRQILSIVAYPGTLLANERFANSRLLQLLSLIYVRLADGRNSAEMLERAEAASALAIAGAPDAAEFWRDYIRVRELRESVPLLIARVGNRESFRYNARMVGLQAHFEFSLPSPVTDRAQWFLLTALAQMAAADTSGALQSLRASKAFFDSCRLWQLQAELLLSSNSQEALEELRHVTPERCGDSYGTSSLHLDLGNALAAVGRMRESRVAFQNAKALAISSGPASAAIAHLDSLENGLVALEVLLRVVEQDPSYWPAWASLWSSVSQTGDQRLLFADLATRLSDEPYSIPEARLARALAAMRWGWHHEAHTWLSKVRDANVPLDELAVALIACAAVETDSTEMAIGLDMLSRAVVGENHAVNMTRQHPYLARWRDARLTLPEHQEALGYFLVDLLTVAPQSLFGRAALTGFLDTLEIAHMPIASRITRYRSAAETRRQARQDARQDSVIQSLAIRVTDLEIGGRELLASLLGLSGRVDSIQGEIILTNSQVAQLQIAMDSLGRRLRNSEARLTQMIRNGDARMAAALDRIAAIAYANRGTLQRHASAIQDLRDWRNAQPSRVSSSLFSIILDTLSLSIGRGGLSLAVNLLGPLKGLLGL